MNADELRLMFERDDQAIDVPEGPQLHMALEFCALYEEHGLLVDGTAPPLWACCPYGKECWEGVEKRDEHAGISLPWVGPDYSRGGVLILGLNFNDAGGFPVAYGLARADREYLSQGRRRIDYGLSDYGGTIFPYRSSRTASALLDHLDGRAVTDTEDPSALADVLQRVTRMQTIKCAPAANWSEPTDAMWHNCPPLLLASEIEIAAPKYIAAFGQDVAWSLEQLSGFAWKGEADRLRWGTLTSDSGTTTVFALGHPRGNLWAATHASLIAHLATSTS